MMEKLNSFYKTFFDKENAEPLGLVRIAVGVLVMLTFLMDAPYIADYYSDDGFVPQAAVDSLFRDYRFSLLDNISTPVVVYAAYFALLAAAFFMTIGYKTRIASILTFVLLLSFHERNWLILTSGDTLLRIMVFYLMLTNSGAAFSIDSMRNKFKTLIPKWNRLLIKYQVSIFYFFSGFSKASGSLWVQGTAAYYAMNNPIFSRFSMEWLNQAPFLVNVLTWGTVFIELSVPFLLWFRKTRLLAIALVIMLQLGIFVTMNIGTFQLLSIAVVLIFLEKSDIENARLWLRKKINLFKAF